MKLAALIARTHHEKWDGTGYPRGLKGEEIPLVGRITGIADVFDALSSERPYKRAYSVASCFQIIREGRENHFDPAVVDAVFDVEFQFSDWSKLADSTLVQPLMLTRLGKQALPVFEARAAARLVDKRTSKQCRCVV